VIYLKKQNWSGKRRGRGHRQAVKMKVAADVSRLKLFGAGKKG
jgi:hypothetical protein